MLGLEINDLTADLLSSASEIDAQVLRSSGASSSPGSANAVPPCSRPARAIASR